MNKNNYFLYKYEIQIKIVKFFIIKTTYKLIPLKCNYIFFFQLLNPLKQINFANLFSSFVLFKFMMKIFQVYNIKTIYSPKFPEIICFLLQIFI